MMNQFRRRASNNIYILTPGNDELSNPSSLAFTTLAFALAFTLTFALTLRHAFSFAIVSIIVVVIFEKVVVGIMIVDGLGLYFHSTDMFEMRGGRVLVKADDSNNLQLRLRIRDASWAYFQPVSDSRAGLVVSSSIVE